MTRDEFLNRLCELLACLPADQVEETKAFYAEAIADRMEDGMTEEEAVAAMGAPGQVAESTLDELPAVPRAIAKTRRKSNVLLWVLAIAGSPVWVPLLAAFAIVALAVYVCLSESSEPRPLRLPWRASASGIFPMSSRWSASGLRLSGWLFSWVRALGLYPSRSHGFRCSG